MHDILTLNCTETGWFLDRAVLDCAGLKLVRGDLFRLHVKGLSTQDFTEIDTGLFVLKTLAQFKAGGDFTAAFSGFDADGYQSLATQQLSIAAAVPSEAALGNYRGAVIAFDANGNPRHLGNGSFGIEIVQEAMTGLESNVPSGITARLTDTAEITGGNVSVTVALTGMTATGCVLVTPITSTGGFTPFQVSYAAGSFTITTPAAPELTPGDGNKFRFQWWLRWKV